MMEHNGASRTVKVKVYGQEYPLKGHDDPEYIRAVARYVDEKMADIQANTTVTAPLRLAVLAALNIADELFKLQREKDDLLAEFEEKAREISEYLSQGMSQV